MAGIKGKGGVKGRSGRKTKAEELGLLALLDKCWTDIAKKRCIERLAIDCESEDFHERHESRKLLLAYRFGKPTEKHEVNGKDGGPIQLKVVYVKERT